MNSNEIKDFLDYKAAEYEQPSFLDYDPIQIPHLFNKKEDIEISGFLISSIAWGNRLSIIKSGKRMLELMDNDPYHFVMQHTEKDLDTFSNFVHRTFNGSDLSYFIRALRNLYVKYDGLEATFSKTLNNDRLVQNINEFRNSFFELKHEKRTEKHVANPFKGSAAKRINMFLRWMVRDSKNGVDFGLWKSISPSQLSCPLDIHSGNVARSLGLLYRKQNDQKAVEELDLNLRKYDPKDPVKYDYALFGLGVFEGLK
ncbi:MAG: TIGR02757 family protein [Flavobacteriaceae bacterium]|nr:TIGR02757 family protein [Flavobacteriaceae bacterium]